MSKGYMRSDKIKKKKTSMKSDGKDEKKEGGDKKSKYTMSLAC